MDVKKIALLVGALVIAAVTAIMAKNMFSGASAPQAVAAAAPEPTGPKVLVATRALPVGTIIGPDSFRYQPWPKDLVQSAYYIEGETEMGNLAGTVVRYAITAGQPITQGALVKPGDRGFLAAALGPGMRAVTVSVSAQSGVAGFVFPGDRIDLVLTQSVSGDGPELKASETIISNLRVLATDQRTVPTNEEGKTEVTTFSTVTLETTPRIAEKIAVAQTIGQLSLSLRSIADNEADLERAIAAGEVKVPEGGDPKADKQMLLAVASRPNDGATTFVTGADVSRFQRRTVPSQKSENSGGSSAVSGSVTFSGPVVRVARGNNVTEVSVGGK
ncbi:Flp pilus assembly protein CpaB [Sphingomonas sp. LaA6.9]|uniref:Flp pilus assembly protein CpaB n=1 Tax=Sphingomonas sp. LaA6.9 TaxID=2919914 RepID=UPI001F4F773F|nr:Flp pilus assembly protein CpaB [Sphingomonas sp. LaA6.9]MCJ8155932.1 Flp pilus assembly protein CpaB [Sphingomonas sp. LaA6.9]